MEDEQRFRAERELAVELVKSFLPGQVNALAKYANARLAVMEQRACAMVEETATQAVSNAEALVEELASDPRKAELFAVAIDAAARSHSEGKIKALAHALAAAALTDDDAQLDRSELVLRAVAELEVPHVRVLEALIEAGGEGKLDPEAVFAGLYGNDDSSRDPILATLIRLGLFSSLTGLTLGGGAIHSVTRFGLDVYELIKRK